MIRVTINYMQVICVPRDPSETTQTKTLTVVSSEWLTLMCFSLASLFPMIF